jgi:hypothetical protein
MNQYSDPKNNPTDDSDHYEDDLITDKNNKSKETITESVDDYLDEC